MNSRRLTFILGLIVMGVFILVSPAMADESDKLTYFTFSTPVELPGVALPAGTYAFKLVDTMADRRVVQVFDKNRKHLYATVLGIADYTPQPSDKTVVRFSETKAGGPPAVKEWFYPGDQYGIEFVYPKSRAQELAKASNQAVPSMPSNLASNITDEDKNTQQASVKGMMGAPLKAEEPNGNEVEVAEVIAAAPPTPVATGSNAMANAAHTVNAEDASTGSSDKLPKTASLLPLLGIIGCFLAAAGALLSKFSKRPI
jgi:hypothetical protein